jgi:Phage head maturation protease
LRFKIDLPNTTTANDVLEEVRMGILSQCSFAFSLPDDGSGSEWHESDIDGVEYERTIRSIDKLYDVSIVTTPAYADTNVSVGKRSMEVVQQTKRRTVNQSQRA